MPTNKLKATLSKYPELAGVFSEEDPESLFHDQKEIGHGNFGAVYYARNIRNAEIVAIKKMQFSGKHVNEKWEEIVKEVRLLNCLQHANIVELKGCYLKNSTCWAVMEYCLGSVSDVIEVHKAPLKEIEIGEISKYVLLALEYLHCQDMIHRDVKAGNILLTDKGTVKLGDFGSVSEHIPANSFVGTPFWLAPEMIMAEADEEKYDCKVDVWSVGITCIEMAERKPPLFHMNVMAVMYHIPQRDPPTLKEPDQWSELFHDFLKHCLCKDPETRYTSREAQEHPFISTPRESDIVFKLIARTKEYVRQVDRQNFKRLQKMLMGDDETDPSSTDTGSLGATSSTISKGAVNKQQLAVTSTSGEECRGSPSLSSAKSLSLDDALDDDDRSGSSITIKDNGTGASNDSGQTNDELSASVPQQPSTETEESMVRSEHTGEVVIQRHSSVISTLSDLSISSAASNVTPSIIPEGEESRTDQASASGEDRRSSDNRPLRADKLTPEDAVKKVLMLAGHTDGFSTLRPQAVISKEAQEYQLQNDLKDQMEAYKRMRAQHKKQMEQLEAKHRSERLTLSKANERELEQVQVTYEKDLDKLKQSQKSEFEKNLKQENSDDRKYRRNLKEKQDQEMKQFMAQQKADYRATKSLMKKEIDEKADWTPNRRKKMYEERKTELLQQQRVSEEEQSQILKTIADHDTVDYRQKVLHERQALEKQMLQEELNLMQLHKERVQEIKKKQLQAINSLRLRQLTALYDMKTEHLNKQHYLEWDNQIAYSKKADRELKKKHVSELKQHPKGLKARKQQIKTSFYDTVKIQQKQYKSLQKHIVATLPKEKQQEILQPLKEEQTRKMSLLASQYEKTIDEVFQQQTVKLDAAQVAEQEALHKQLQQEQEMLQHFQEKQEIKLLYQQDKEKTSLDEKIEKSRVDQEKDIFEESTRMQNMRLERQRKLQRKHLQELKDFAEKYSSTDRRLSNLSSTISLQSETMGGNETATHSAN